MTAQLSYRLMASHACGSIVWKQAYHLETHSILEEDIVVLADSKVMGVEEGLVHGELLACHLLPILIKLVDINGHFGPCQRLDLAACTDFCELCTFRCTLCSQTQPATCLMCEAHFGRQCI